MKTICGVTMRGVAYFGASVHICIGGIFFLLFLDQLLHQAYYKNISNMDSLKFDKESVIYFGLFLPLGILIFKSIDKENKTLLKWSSAVFVTLQLFGMIIKVRFGPNYGPSLMNHPRGPYHNHSGGPSSSSSSSTIIDNLKILSIEILATLSYLVTLYLYGRQLDCFPGRIYSQGGIPLYSTSSTFFTDHNQQHQLHHHHRGSSSHRHGNRHGRSNLNNTTPFTYNFEPPPPYSSTNNLTNLTTVDGSGGGGSQQPSSSRSDGGRSSSSSSVFGRIGNISFKKNLTNYNSQQQPTHPLYHHHHPHHPLHHQNASTVGINNSPSPVVVVVNATNDLNRNSSTRCVVVPSSESDSSSPPCAPPDHQQRRQNDLSLSSDRRSRHDDSLLNLKDVN